MSHRVPCASRRRGLCRHHRVHPTPQGANPTIGLSTNAGQAQPCRVHAVLSVRWRTVRDGQWRPCSSSGCSTVEQRWSFVCVEVAHRAKHRRVTTVPPPPGRGGGTVPDVGTGCFGVLRPVPLSGSQVRNVSLIHRFQIARIPVPEPLLNRDMW